jgi:hypothetical protein
MSEQFSDSEKEAAKFLDRDFQQCFEQMRHYDDQIIDVCKFAFTAYATVLGASLALYKYGVERGVDYRWAAGAILLVGLLIGLSLFCLAIRNRVYYVVVTRYINEHRAFFLRNRPLGFENKTRMYADPAQPPFFHWRSSQSLLLYVLSILNALIFGVLAYMASDYLNSRHKTLIVLTLAFLITELLFGISYLNSRETKSASRAVFGTG